MSTDPADLLAALRREPDVEGPDLVAVDGADRLLLETALLQMDTELGPASPVAVVDDAYGALTLGAVAVLGADDVRVAQDLLVGEVALERNAARTGLAGRYRTAPLAEVARDAGLVLVRAPKGLDALREVAEAVAAVAAPGVTVLVGARVKHMTPAMNDVLRGSFDEVSATLGRHKARVLVARGPRPGPASYPRCRRDAASGLTVCAHGAAFAGGRVDAGTRALLAQLDAMAPDARSALDLGCGTGVLAVALARARPGLEVLATDQSAAAVASARATAEANGVAVRVTRDDAASAVGGATVDLVVCNPPFHVGPAVVTAAAERLFAAAGRVLRPGGELWCVWNSSLPHRPALRRLVGPTETAHGDRRFVVTRSVR